MSRDDDRKRRPERPARPSADALADDSIVALDSTLPPTPLKQLLAADGASIYVLSADAELGDTIQQAGGEQYPIHLVQDWADLTAFIEHARCRIVLLDVDALPGPVERCLDELIRLAPGIVVLIAARRDAAQHLIGLLSERRVHRLLIKPATVGVTRLLLDSAVNRFLQLRETAPDPFDEPAEGLTRRPPAQRRQRQRRIASVLAVMTSVLIAGVGLAIALGPGGLSEWRTLGGWIGDAPLDRMSASEFAAEAGRGADTSSARDRAGDAGGAAGAEGALDDAADAGARPGAGGDPAGAEAPTDPHAAELERAHAALEAGRLASPPDANALALFQRILAEAPEHAAARQGLRATLEQLFARAERALVAGDVAAAGTTLDQIRRAQPDAARLMILDAQLTAARERAAAASEQAAGGAAQGPAAGEPARGDDAAGADGVDTDAAGGSRPADARNAPAADAPASSAAGGPEDPARSAAGGAAAAGAADDANAADDASAAARSAARGSPPNAAAADPSEYDSLLAIARARLGQGRLTEPAGDSALDYLERAEAQNAADPRLVELRTRLAEAIAAEARIGLDAGDVDAAERLVDLAFDLGLAPEAQAQLDLELAAAQAQAGRRERAEWLALARERIDAGSLTVPEDDSAWHYLARLESAEPGFAGLETAWAELADALGEQASEAVEAGEWDRAEASIDAFERAGAGPERVADLRERLGYARRQAEYLATPATSAEMTLAEAGSVAYPDEARNEDIEGWAEVEFVVDRQGRPRDVRVVATEPEGYFEQAALDSVRASRYEPFESGGRVYERLVRVRVRFGLR